VRQCAFGKEGSNKCMEHRKKNKLALYAILGLSFLPIFAFATTTVPFIPYNLGNDDVGSLNSYLANNWNLYTSGDVFVEGTVGFAVQPCFVNLTNNTAGTYYIKCEDFTSEIEYVSSDFVWSGTAFIDETRTHIISLDPAQSSSTPSGVPVYINAVAYIAEESSFWDTIKINLWTRDENSVLSRLVFTYQTDLYTVHFNGTATSTGFWRYSSTTMLADGNYTVQFSLGNSTLGGLVPNPFGGDTQVLTHQFTVGTSTFLGNLNQTIGQDIEDILQGKTSTSTAVLLSRCKPWSEAGFDVVDCLSGLMIPDKGKMEELFEDFKQGIVYKFPWGYGFRFFALATGATTSTPPVLGFSVPDDEFFPPSLRNKAVSFDPWQALSSTSPLTTADGFGQGNLMDTVMPYWNIIIYGMVVFGVSHKVLGHRHTQKVKEQNEV